jgi:transcriptional regulator with XRE-family HTH domain
MARRVKGHSKETVRPPAGELDLDRRLGLSIRRERARHHLTLAVLAERTGLSVGMISKIENGQASMSLDSLSRLARALGVSVARLFADVEADEGTAQHIAAGMGMEVVRRGTRRGHTYHLLSYNRGPVRLFEPFLISLDDKAEEFPLFEHAGTEFIYMLQGKLEYRYGKRSYVLAPGDSLTFKGSVPHGPKRLIKLPIRFLSVFIYGEEADAV